MIPQPHRKRLLFMLVLVAFLASAYAVGRRWLRDHAGDRVTLRFAHWQLEPGVRDAFDTLARDYERLHPNVRIEQLLIPENIFRQWCTTQLVGGSAPDLVQIGKGVGHGPTKRYFVPFTAEANQPNPYNAGTSLAQTPWRNTFIDGMNAGYDPETFECYSATLFTGSVRMYYNADLLREITGSDTPPATFNELRLLCARVRDFARANNRDLVPIAGSQLSGSILMDGLFQSQTQRLACELNPGAWFPVDVEEFSLAYLNRRWSLEDPAFRQAAELMRVAGQLMPPGFMESGREQANLMFVQGRALMMMGFSVENAGVTKQVKFRLRAFRCPQPATDDPRFGPQMVAPAAENALATYGGFGLTRSSRHPEQALDFLRFLTSEASCRTYTRISRNLPVIVSVPVSEELHDFAPQLAGYPPGPSYMYSLEPKALLLRTQHLLYGPEGDTAVFIARFGREFGDALRRDFERNIQFRTGSVRRTESTLAATRQLLLREPTSAILTARYQSQVEAQNELEAGIYYTQLRLDQAAAR